MVTDSELTFWIVCLILAILFVISVPFVNNYLEYMGMKKWREDLYDAADESNKD